MWVPGHPHALFLLLKPPPLLLALPSTCTPLPPTPAQIRAANLSGDCSFWQEALRGNLGGGLVGQHVRCVERRALLSVGLNPHCQGGKAEAAVAEMLPRCLKDTDPWPSVPGLK